MRIALVVPGGVDRSGTERVIPCLLWLIEALVDEGHDVQVFAARQEAAPGRWSLLGAEVYNVAGRPVSISMLGALIAEHRRSPFDVMHGFWADGGGLAASLAGRLLGIPAVLTLAGGELEAIPDIRYGSRQSAKNRLVVWLATRLACHVTAPSLYLCSRARSLGIEAIHIPLGVALDRWPPRPPLPRDCTAPIRLLHIASLNRVKDQPMLLRAARTLECSGLDFELTIIGEDTLAGEIQRMAVALNIDHRVKFVGFQPHHALRAWVERADLLVMTSRHEAGPLVALEAAVAGVPTVGTSVGHIADFCPDAAVAVAVGDHDALAAAIMDLARDDDRRLRLAASAQARALDCDARTTMRRFHALYKGHGISD